MTDRPLSHAIAATTMTIECVTLREAYRRNSETLAGPLARIPDGHVEVGALDGVATVVPESAS